MHGLPASVLVKGTVRLSFYVVGMCIQGVCLLATDEIRARKPVVLQGAFNLYSSSMAMKVSA